MSSSKHYLTKKLHFRISISVVSLIRPHMLSAIADLVCLFKPRLFVRPTGVFLLNFFCSGIQFHLLLSPYLCFISLLYPDLHVLGDDALIS